MNSERTHVFFHGFMIHFALWAFAALAVFYGVRHILYVTENGASRMALDIILSVMLILTGLFIVRIRFDLAALRKRTAAELLWVSLAAAAIFLGLHWVEDLSGEDCYQGCVPKAIIFTCWGIAMYRYYVTRRHLFTGQ